LGRRRVQVSIIVDLFVIVFFVVVIIVFAQIFTGLSSVLPMAVYSRRTKCP